MNEARIDGANMVTIYYKCRKEIRLDSFVRKFKKYINGDQIQECGTGPEYAPDIFRIIPSSDYGEIEIHYSDCDEFPDYNIEIILKEVNFNEVLKLKDIIRLFLKKNEEVSIKESAYLRSSSSITYTIKDIEK